uniref:Uncharacterized protein n=1 Tax=Trichuris muris TaxID=70415 RepID=A0A5S6QZ30_TRIMR
MATTTKSSRYIASSVCMQQRTMAEWSSWSNCRQFLARKRIALIDANTTNVQSRNTSSCLKKRSNLWYKGAYSAGEPIESKAFTTSSDHHDFQSNHNLGGQGGLGGEVPTLALREAANTLQQVVRQCNVRPKDKAKQDLWSNLTTTSN